MTRKEFIQNTPFRVPGNTGTFRYAEEKGGEIERLTSETIHGVPTSKWMFVTNVSVISENHFKAEIPSALGFKANQPIRYDELVKTQP